MTQFEFSSEQIAALARRLAQDLKPALKNASFVIAAALQNEIAPYPPATEANTPHPPSYYRRGSGTVRMTAEGVETELRNSEQLGRKWALQDSPDSKTTLVNTASYAPYVHSSEYQAWFHTERGWKTEVDAAAAVFDSGMAVAIIGQVLEKLLTGSGGAGDAPAASGSG